VTIGLRTFASETAASRTARFSVDRTSDDLVQGPPETRETGVFDFVTSSGRFSESGQSGGAMSAVAAGGAYFIPMTDDLGPIDPHDPCYGKKWGVFDYPKYAKEGWPVKAAKASPVPVEPGRVLASLRDAQATVTAVGSEDVRGTKTTHYRVTVGSPELDADFTDSDQYSQERLTALDVWVDSQQRLRRARAVAAVHWGNAISTGTTTLPADLEGGSYNTTTTIELSDYGVPVHVTRPADSESCDFPSFFGRSMATFH
jgi:hypothetical protein